MFERVRLKIGVSVARFRFRKYRDPIIQFTNAVSRARRVLILLPESTGEAPYVLEVLRFFNQRFLGNSVQVVVRKDLAKYIVQNQNNNIILFDESEINKWFLPRKQLLQKVKKATFDVVVDLNLRFALPSAILCKESQAPIRIGFAKPYADMFYNLQVQTRGTTTLGAYKQFQRCMEML